MDLALIDNQYDNCMKTLPMSGKVTYNILNSIKNPLIVDNKDKIPQWKFCTIKGEKRCTENIGNTNILILDFDDKNYNFQSFEERFKEYQYILHTSYSYDGNNSKFRVLLFLDKEYEIDKMFAKCVDKIFSPYHILLNFFNNVDPASFVRAQFFKVPAKKNEEAPYYYNIHKGKLFCLNDIEGYSMAYTMCEVKNEEDRRRKQLENIIKYAGNTKDLSKVIDYIQRKIEELPAGMRHNGVFSLAAWGAKCGMNYYDFIKIKPSWADKSYFKQLKRLEKEWEDLR